MGIIEITLTSIGLATDAFAASICKGLSIKQYNLKKGLIIGIYFGLFQGFTYGQTLGKKIMRLKIVSNDGNKVSYKQLIFRTLFLYSIINYLGIILFAFFLSFFQPLLLFLHMY